jgi:hypothetical protein
MLPGSLVHVHPVNLLLYSRGSQGTGALPTSGQVIVTPVVSAIACQVNAYMNPADGAAVLQDDFGSAGGNEMDRYAGLYYADVFLYQDVDATIQLQVRTLLRLLDATGAADQFKTLITRVSKANFPYAERFQLMNSEARFRYTNGSGNTTVHDFNIVLRPL